MAGHRCNQQGHRGNRRRHPARQERSRPRAAGGGSWLARPAYKEAMRATDFEFRNRFWFFGAAFSLAFSGYFVQHYPMAWLIGRDGWRWVLAGAAVLVALA